jgi:asparagine synthase (glutamine-hydrolysing)
MLQVSSAMKTKVTVLLTGDGGDDVFLGYTHHRNFWRAQNVARHLPRAAALSWRYVRPFFNGLSALRRPVHLIDYATAGLGATMRAHDGLPLYLRWALLGERLNERQAALSHRNLPMSPESAKALLTEFLDYERRTRFVSEYMTKVDGATMYHGLEARSPFLDQQLWQWAAALPYEARLRNGELKAVLREIVRRRVGADFADRPKQGFTIPVETWLTGPWKPQMEQLLDRSPLIREGWIQQAALEKYMQRLADAPAIPRQMWYLLVLDQWLRAHEDVPVLTRV